jgi:hypothetical protein
MPLQFEPVGRSLYVETDELSRVQRIQHYRCSSSRRRDDDHVRQPVLDTQLMADERPVRLAIGRDVEVLERIFQNRLRGLPTNRIRLHGRLGDDLGRLLRFAGDDCQDAHEHY